MAQSKNGWGSFKTGKGTAHRRNKSFLSGLNRTGAQKRADAKRKKR